MRPALVETGPAHWVTSFITSRPVCVYSCSQLRELWFNDLFMYNTSNKTKARSLIQASNTHVQYHVYNSLMARLHIQQSWRRPGLEDHVLCLDQGCKRRLRFRYIAGLLRTHVEHVQAICMQTRSRETCSIRVRGYTVRAII